MTYEELKERVAKAMFNTPLHGMGGVSLEWEMSPLDIQQYYRDAADAAIALTLEEAATVADKRAQQNAEIRLTCAAMASEIRALGKP
jgi:hypothetical protein